MKTGEMESTIKRLIQREDGITPALQLLEQMVGAAAIGDKEAENLRRVIERRRIRFVVESAVDGAEVDSTGMTYENALASLQDLVSEIDDPDEKKWANGVAAMFGADAAAEKIKEGAGVARRVGQVITAPQDEDMGIAVQTNGRQIEPVWLQNGEFIVSVPAVEGMGLRAGAAPEDAHTAGLEELNRLHEELRNILLNTPTPMAVEKSAAPTEIVQEEHEVAEDMSPADLIEGAQIIDERRERAAVTDGTGRWLASDELINAAIAAESGGDPNAVSKAGAIGLLQILPSTARDPGFGVTGLEGTNDEVVAQLKNPVINPRLGSDYLSAMLHRYHGDAYLALVAFNAGPARADRAAKDERPLDKFAELYTKAAKETLPYIMRVLGNV